MSLALVLQHRVTADAALREVFDYLADFTTTNEWDPRAGRTVLLEGAGEVGSRYGCEVRFLGRTTHMEYTITELERPRRIRWEGRNRWVRAVDTLELEVGPHGETVVTYSAQFSYARLPTPATLLLAFPLRQLCEEAQRGLQATFDARWPDLASLPAA